MNLTREEIEILLQIFEDYNDMLSEFSRGTMVTEEWEVYNKLVLEYGSTNNK